jgi:hypothetical protein
MASKSAKKNADRWRSATYEEVLRGKNLEEPIFLIVLSFKILKTFFKVELYKKLFFQ